MLLTARTSSESEELFNLIISLSFHSFIHNSKGATKSHPSSKWSTYESEWVRRNNEKDFKSLISLSFFTLNYSINFRAAAFKKHYTMALILFWHLCINLNKALRARLFFLFFFYFNNDVLPLPVVSSTWTRMYDAIINNNNIKKKTAHYKSSIVTWTGWREKKKKNNVFVVAVVSGVFFFCCLFASCSSSIHGHGHGFSFF